MDFAESSRESEIFRTIGEKLSGNVAICSDVGQNQMWLAQSLRITNANCRILNSGGLGAMGYALPAAIGACYSQKFNRVMAIMGDGGFQMNLQELCLIGNSRLPITIIVLNNHSLGMIREMHEKYYENRCIGSVEGFFQPELEKLSDAYKINYSRIECMKDLMEKLGEENSMPNLIDIDLGCETVLEPVLLGMETLDNQSPYITDEKKKEIYTQVKRI